MSSHHKFEVFIKPSGDGDNEERVQRFHKHVRELAAMWNTTHQAAGIEIEVSLGEVEQA